MYGIVAPSHLTAHYSLLHLDINLFSTTLRFARTNEVSSLNNSSIAASRIVNCNRSPNAIVFLDKITHASILDGDKLQQFQERLEKYVSENPRTWDSLAFVRIDNIDADMEQVKFSMSFRHRNSWQDAGRILLNRADLFRFVHDTLKGMSLGKCVGSIYQDCSQSLTLATSPQTWMWRTTRRRLVACCTTVASWRKAKSPTTRSTCSILQTFAATNNRCISLDLT
jgi:hypothetical protein